VILVCGEALMDVLVDADGSRHPVPGGGPFNTARALARLGIPAAFLGRLSEDAYGQRLADQLVAAGASLDFASRGREPTTVALAEVDPAGVAHYEFQTEGTSAQNLTLAMLPDRLGPEIVALHVGTLGLVLEPMATTLIELVRREQGRRLVMVDPNIRAQLIPDRSRYRRRLEEELFPASTIVKASEQDLAWLYPSLDVEAACAGILARGPHLVVATLGAEGAFGLTRLARAHVGVPPVEVMDTIGAGDVFSAALLVWLHDRGLLQPDLSLSAAELKTALAFGCRAASWSCTQAGAASPSRRDLCDADEHRSGQRSRRFVVAPGQ
jgi:fructokinase